jgi:hypothetical protein
MSGSTIEFIGVSGHVGEPGPTINAQLVRVSKDTGALFNIGNPAVLSFIGPGVTYQEWTQIAYSFDFAQFFYYVRVDISRTDPGQIVGFYAVQLTFQSAVPP